MASPNPAQAALNDLAVSVYHQPGVYALLLGSGMSIAAGIPTAWGIVRDLLRQQAQAAGIEPLPEGLGLEEWYRSTVAREPDYSDLIHAIAPTSASQRTLLEGYFEPNEEDRAAGRKQVGPAHAAAAGLVAAGYIRVIITTNFDTLMEQALQAQNVPFFVITEAAEIPGVPPLVQGGVFIIKLHGDYRKANVRNSNADLNMYPPELDALLDRVIDEFGLICCGWSGVYDQALRRAIERSPNRRYPLWFSSYSEPATIAQTLIQHRHGRVIPGQSADDFFGQLEARVLALQDGHWTPPQSNEALAAEVRRYLGEPDRYEVRLTQLFDRLADDLQATLNDETPFLAALSSGRTEDAVRAYQYVESRTQPLLHVIGTLVKHDRSERFASHLAEALSRLDWRAHEQTQPLWSRFSLVAAALIGYGLAVLAADARRFGYLRAVLQTDLTSSQPSQPREAWLAVLGLAESMAAQAPFQFIAAQPRLSLQRVVLDSLETILKPYVNPHRFRVSYFLGEVLLAAGFADLHVNPDRRLSGRRGVHALYLEHANQAVLLKEIWSLLGPYLERLDAFTTSGRTSVRAEMQEFTRGVTNGQFMWPYASQFGRTQVDP